MDKQTVLIADDEPSVRYLVSFIVEEKAGKWAYEAKNGEMALELARSCQPDLLILDVRMPGGLNGHEVAHALKSDPVTSGIKILMLSAMTTVADRILGLQHGADDYLVKPFHPDELVARVDALLRRTPLTEAGA
jgi:DNA-binding response OmpR family regulator